MSLGALFPVHFGTHFVLILILLPTAPSLPETHHSRETSSVLGTEGSIKCDLAVLKKIGIIINIGKKFKDSQHPPIITNRERQEGKVGSLNAPVKPIRG